MALTARNAAAMGAAAMVGVIAGTWFTPQRVHRNPGHTHAVALMDAAHAFDQATVGLFAPPAPGVAVNHAVLEWQRIGDRVHHEAVSVATALQDYASTDTYPAAIQPLGPDGKPTMPTQPSAATAHYDAAARVHAGVEALRHELDGVDNAPTAVLVARAKLRKALADAEADVP